MGAGGSGCWSSVTPALPRGAPAFVSRLAAAAGPKITVLEEVFCVLRGRAALGKGGGDGSKGFIEAGSVLGVLLL